MLVAAQVALSFCCGALPILFWWPAFLAMILGLVAQAEAAFPVWSTGLLMVIGSVVYAVITVRWLGEGRRLAGFAVSAGLVVVAATAATATALSANDGTLPWHTLATATPSVLAQAIAWWCVRSTSAQRWFRECEPYLVDPKP
jgi:hypothetical protein